MKRNVIFSTALLLVISLIAVSCAPANLQNSTDSDTILVYFGNLEAKAINTDVYDVSGSASFGTAQVDTGIIDNFYWAYTAVKKDDYFKFGEQTTFASVVTGAGLDKSFSFSKGQWEFTLQAFASAEDRTAGTPVIYEGTQTVNATSDANINIPMSYCYESGTGSVNFDISVSISQEELSSISDYEITKVLAKADSLSAELTGNDTKTSWTGSIENVPNGLVTTSYEIYVASETEPRAKASKTVIVMTNLETDVKGTATISLTGAKAIVSFNTSTPDEQPDENVFIFPTSETTYTITYVLDESSIPSDKIGLKDSIYDLIEVTKVLGVYPETYIRGSVDDMTVKIGDSDNTRLNGFLLSKINGVNVNESYKEGIIEYSIPLEVFGDIVVTLVCNPATFEGATESEVKTYTINYDSGSVQNYDFSDTTKFPTSYTRGGSSDSVVEIHWPSDFGYMSSVSGVYQDPETGYLIIPTTVAEDIRLSIEIKIDPPD